jgi:hypothetical protein
MGRRIFLLSFYNRSVPPQWRAERGPRCSRREEVIRLLVDEPVEPELELPVPVPAVMTPLCRRDIRLSSRSVSLIIRRYRLEDLLLSAPVGPRGGDDECAGTLGCDTDKVECNFLRRVTDVGL